MEMWWVGVYVPLASEAIFSAVPDMVDRLVVATFLLLLSRGRYILFDKAKAGMEA